MIRYLQGKVVDKIRSQVVLDVHGVGYGVFVTPKLLTNSTHGEELICYVAESIREDAYDLYGFGTPAERDMFEMVRKVSGIGPKGALNLLGFYSVDDLNDIIQSSNIDRLSLVSGIGKKTASKIVVELKDRTSLPLVAGADDDTVSALQTLGYTTGEINHILTKLPKNLDSSEAKITWVLQNMGHD